MAISHGLQPSLFAALGFSISWLVFRLPNMKKRRTPEIMSEKVRLIKEAIDEAEDRVVRLEERHDRLLKEACSYYLCNRELVEALAGARQVMDEATAVADGLRRMYMKMIVCYYPDEEIDLLRQESRSD